MSEPTDTLRKRVADLEALIRKITGEAFACSGPLSDEEVKALLEAKGWQVKW